MKNAMCEVGKSVLGQARRREADWFREREDVLRPLFGVRSSSHTQWLSSGKERDRKKFVVAKRVARKAVREVKNKWFQAKAAEASAGRNGGRVVWMCICDIQRSKRFLCERQLQKMRMADSALHKTHSNRCGGGTSQRF